MIGSALMIRGALLLLALAGIVALGGCGSTSASDAPIGEDTAALDVRPAPASSEPDPEQAFVSEPSGFTGNFSTMDERQRCKAGDNVIVCASTLSGQLVRLDRSGASYEGEVATSYPAPSPLGVGNEIRTASGITCLNSDRGIECSRGGHGFVIGDSAVVLLRGPNEERFPASTQTALEPDPADPAAEEVLGEEEPPDDAAAGGEFCWPETVLPSVTIDEVYIPETTIPETTIGGVTYPARTLPERYIPARTIPARTIPGQCFDVGAGFLPPWETSVLVDGYAGLDPDFDQVLSDDYWSSAPSLDTGYTAADIPDYSATGYGELNAAGYPKNQYVKSYYRRDGTLVSAYWRNSPSDGLPTCRVISC